MLGTQILPVKAAYEDFTTWTEVDVGADRITVTANNVAIHTENDEDTYVYNDYGADFFTDFTHQFDGMCDDVQSGVPSMSAYLYGQGNVVDDFYGGYQLGSAADGFGVMFYATAGALLRIYLRECYDGTPYADWTAFNTEDVWCYFELTKSGTSLTLEIYSSDALRTAGGGGDYDTLTLTLHEDYSMRYLFAPWCFNNANNEWQEIEVANLEFVITYPACFDFGETSHLANTETTFYANWTAGTSENMSHWIIGSNVSGTFTNTTYKFDVLEETLLENASTGGTNGYADLRTGHPSSVAVFSSTSQGVKLNYGDVDCNITKYGVSLRKGFGSPNVNLTIGIYEASGSNPNSFPNSIWSSIENSTKLNSTTLTTSFVAYNFTFDGSFQMAHGSYYFFAVLVVDVVLINSANTVRVLFNDQTAFPNPYVYGNEATYHDDSWSAEPEIWDMDFKLYGVPIYDTTWANYTTTLPIIVGQVIQWQQWANNTKDDWNTIGLQTFTITGVNFTLYFSHDGYFTINAISRIEEPLWAVNGTEYGFANGTDINLLASPKNASYYWLNFTWDSGNSIENNVILNVILPMEGYEFWCYFNSTPTAGIGEVYLVARFMMNVSIPNIYDPILFDASTSESSSAISSYTWDFGDGDSGSGVTATHDYEAYGNHTVQLTVVSTDGSDSHSQWIVVGELPQWLGEFNTLPLNQTIFLVIIGIFFSSLFFSRKEVPFGAISFGVWLVTGMVWILITPVAYMASMLFFGIAIIILILTIIQQFHNLKVDRYGADLM